MRNKTPVKGQPDFTTLSDSRVKAYRNLIADMIGSYSQFPEYTQILTQIWKDLTSENADRISHDTEENPVFDSLAKRCLKKNFKKISKNT